MHARERGGECFFACLLLGLSVGFGQRYPASLGTMDTLFVRVSSVICWINSLRSPRTLPRAVATNANFELRCFLGTSICHCFVGGNGTSSLSDRPTERPSKQLAFFLGTKLFTKLSAYIHTDNTIQAPGLEPCPWKRAVVTYRYTDPTSVFMSYRLRAINFEDCSV